MTTQLKLTLIILFIVQVFISMNFELAHDEAYYWLYSKQLDFGYFDHPPFAGVIIRAFSFMGHSELAIRLGFILLQFGTLFIVHKLIPKADRLWITLLFFSFPLASIGGMLALPDMPLLFMTAVYLWFLAKYLKDDHYLNSGALGFTIALLFYAKYHGVLLVLFTILAVPKLLLRKSFYLVALVALVAFVPHLWWLYEHDFSTLRYHFLERPSSTFSLKRSLEFVGLQLILAGLFIGPVLWWDIFKLRTSDTYSRCLKLISFGTVIFFLISSFSKKPEANWTIFLACPLVLLAAQAEIWKRSWSKTLIMISFIICISARFILPIDPHYVVRLKRLREFHGWKSWSQSVLRSCGDKNIMANSYQIASKLSFYLDRYVPSLNYRSRKNQFDYWQFETHLKSQEVCYITDKGQFSGEVTVTPELKELKIVTSESLDQLLEKKRKLLR